MRLIAFDRKTFDGSYEGVVYVNPRNITMVLDKGSYSTICFNDINQYVDVKDSAEAIHDILYKYG